MKKLPVLVIVSLVAAASAQASGAGVRKHGLQLAQKKQLAVKVVSEPAPTLSRGKFPVPGFSIPVISHFFPVNLRREFAKKSLRHSGFWRRNRRTKPLNRKIPCIFPC